MTCEAAEVHLVNDCLGKRSAERDITLPIISSRVRDDAFQRRRHVIARLASCVPIAGLRPGDAPGIWIEQHLLRIEPEPFCRVERPSHAIPIDLSRSDARHEHVPVMVCAVVPRVELYDP